MNFEVDGIDGEVVVLESGFDNVGEFGAELLDVEGIFDADDDIAIFGRNERGVLEPGRKIAGGNFLLNFGKGVFPDVVHLDLLYGYIIA